MRNRSLAILTAAFFVISCHHNTQFLKEVKLLSNYPSASAIEYANGHFYILGDDATHLLVMDSSFAVTDSIQLFASFQSRIPKNVKPDMEAMAFIAPGSLLITGSGSLDTLRNKAVLFNALSKQAQFLQLDTFYRRLKSNGLAELNIEGLCKIPGTVILSNRGHKGSPRNHLLLTSTDFFRKQSTAPLTIIKVGSNKDSTIFNGVSGMAYAERSDKLILTVSTEDTRSVYEDGAIGKSYLWVIDNISSKKRWNFINPNRIIDLDETDPRFKGQKIESVCVIKETKHFMQLVLAADNDDGSSTLFRLDVSKK